MLSSLLNDYQKIKEKIEFFESQDKDEDAHKLMASNMRFFMEIIDELRKSLPPQP